MKQITIEGSPYATDYWYRGEYIDNKGKKYQFDISNPEAGDTEVIWDGEGPKDELGEIRQSILSQFFEK